jgi:hypothetical protein
MSDEGQQAVSHAQNDGRFVQRMISLAGLVLFLVLSLTWPGALLRPLPTFAGRLYQIRIPLLELLAAIVWLNWWALLLAVKNRKESERERLSGIPQRPRKGLPLWVRLILASSICIGLFIFIRQDFAKFLWPSQAEMLGSVINGLFALGFIFGPFLRQPRNVTQVPAIFSKRNHGTGKVAVNSLVLFAVVLVVSVAVIVGVDLATNTFAPAYGTTVRLLCAIPVFLTCAVVWALLVPWDTIFGNFGLPDEVRK